MGSWMVKHLTIEGQGIDRETSWADLELELHPVGTSLPKELQSHCLMVSIRGKKTWIDAEGIKELKRFLEEET